MLRTHRRRSLTFLAALGLGMLLSSAATTAHATTAEPSPEAPPEAASELIWTADPSPAGVEAAQARSEAFSAAADPVTWAGCGVGVDPQKVVRSFPQGKILRCGNANFGYFHIKAGHQGDWESKSALTGQNWRDVADIGINGALASPEVVKDRPSNDSKCYSRKIYLVNTQNNQTVGTTIVRFAAGVRSNNIITAFPATGHCTGNE
ncbi:hypothetical protein [Microbacterium arborescens]|uniref:hypothetical protein n=1 Tax=Microbacterium arborescens TaxID=33883 RepID=UPI002782034B|nr:hypothetical protein [Microbacterium arborescens]MDQ1217465.1 hypothetical protein [Microbacterium arborescens]